MTQTSERPVRVTIEGTAHHVAGKAGGRLVVERITYPGGTFLLDVTCPAVTVEDVEPPRTWTDGDVVQVVVDPSVVWVRGSEAWTAFADEAVTRDVESGKYRVLRYQAGEQ